MPALEREVLLSPLPLAHVSAEGPGVLVSGEMDMIFLFGGAPKEMDLGGGRQETAGRLPGEQALVEVLGEEPCIEDGSSFLPISSLASLKLL